MVEQLAPRLEHVLDRAAGDAAISWSVSVRLSDGRRCAGLDDESVLATASVGKILLLAETARQVEQDPDLAHVLLHRRLSPPVGQAGMWQQLTAETLSVNDLVVLVSTLSDNLATNVLLAHIGLPAVESLARELGLTRTALLDRIRSQRGPGDPPQVSVGSADELSRLVSDIDRDALLSPRVSQRLRGWLSGNADLSMVLSPFGLDPLAHRQPTPDGLAVWNKTGSDPGVAADVGAVRVSDRSVGYAVIANWPPEGSDVHHATALQRMAEIGATLRDHLRQ